MVLTLGKREEVPAIYPLLEGTIVQTLRCLRPECQQAHTSLKERSHALQVSLSSEDGEILYRTVQQAVDSDRCVTTRVECDKICPFCGFQQDDWEKATQLTELPRVLMVVLNRWKNHHSDGGLLHAVAADRILRFRGVCYDLCATMVHLGESPMSGHYIALARHRTRDATLWGYDDQRRVTAMPEEVAPTCSDYRGLGQMQSYVLLYERAS